MKKLFVLSVALVLTAGVAAAQETDVRGGPTRGNPPIPYGGGGVGAFLGCFAVPAQGGLPVGLENDGAGNLWNTEIVADEFFIQDTGGGFVAGPFSGVPNTGNGLGITTNGTSVFISDTADQDVDEYTTAGAYVGSSSVAAETSFPEGITWNPSSGTFFLVDGDVTAPDNVFEYSAAGTLINTYPLTTVSTDGIAWDGPRQSFWVYDSGSDSVTQYDTSFNALLSFPGTAANGEASGEGVAVIGNSVFVTATGTNVVCEFDISDVPIIVPAAGPTALAVLVVALLALGSFALTRRRAAA